MPSIDLSILNQKATPSFYADTLANRPAPSFVGRVFISTDTFDLYRDTGTAWDLLSPSAAAGVTGTGVANQIAFWSGTTAITGENNLWWDTINDRLGINTNTPGASFDVHSATGIVAQLNVTTATNNTELSFQNSGSGKWRIGNSYNSAANDFQIFDVVNSLQRFSIKNTGQTFVGTQTTTSGQFVVNNSTSDNHIVIIGANAPSLRINNSGSGATQQIGFGLSTTTNNFIQGTTGGELCIFNSNTTASPILFGVYNGTNTQEAARISAARNFLIGSSTDPGQKLYVNGTVLFDGSVTGTGNTSNYSVTASSGSASSKKITSTLIASANSDNLIGLDIAPTFTNGAFTSVKNIGLRVQGINFFRGGGNITTNIAIGDSNTLNANTSGSNNIAIGISSLNKNNTGIRNIAIGNSALNNITSGGTSVAIGYQALSSISTNGSSVAVGDNAAQTTTGTNTTSIGASSLQNITGANNTAVGSFAIQGSASGAAQANTAIGANALQAITTGNNNTALGYQAARYFGAGLNNATTTTNGVYIGYDVRPSANGNTNEIVISGYTGSGDGRLGLGSNTTTIGNANTVFTALFGNLLIGTQTNGASKLRIVGLPTSSAGLSSGDVYSNAGILTIVP